MGCARRRVLCRDDERARGAPRAARSRSAVLDARRRTRGAGARRNGQDALQDAGRPSRRGGADALPRRPPFALPVLAVRLSSITDITLTLGHLAELIKAYFQHRPQLTAQASLRYVDEEEPTGTAGSLASVEGLDQTFLVMN